MKRTLLAAAIGLGFASAANANVITTEVNILGTDPGAVQYVNFLVTQAGVFNINAEGSSTLGATYNPDPQIHLFSGSLSLANLLASDDDGGVDLNSLISGINLGIGSYILAVSEFSFDASAAVSGLNAGSVGDPGPIRITIGNGRTETGTVQFAVVPEPASLALLGIGLAGLGAMRRRKAD